MLIAVLVLAGLLASAAVGPARADDPGPWSGSISLSSTAASFTSSEPAPTVTAQVAPAVSAGYQLSVYDDHNRLICVQSYGNNSSCTTTVNVALNTSSTLTAYVAMGDPPATGPPTNDVRAVSNPVTITNWAIDSATDIAEIVALLPGLEDPCIELFPVGPPSGSSLNALQESCEEGLAAGLSWQAIIKRIVDSYGTVDALRALVSASDGGSRDGAPPGAQPSNPQAAPTAPQAGPPSPVPPQFDPTFVGGGTQRLLNRQRLTGYGFQPATDEQADAAMVFRQCIRLAAAPAANFSLADCESLPIFVPGSDVPQAAQHDFDVIWQSPARLALSAVSRPERATQLSTTWYDSFPSICPRPRPLDQAGIPQDCDEYPYFSSVESGPQADGSLLPDQLRLIDHGQNTKEGRLLGGFYTVCGLTVAPTGSPQNRYLVVPLPQQEQFPTMAYCAAGTTPAQVGS